MFERERNPDSEESERMAREGMSGTSSVGSGTGQVEPGTSSSESGNVVDLAKQKGSQIGSQAQEKSGEMLEQARQEVSHRLSGQKDVAADTLNSVAHAVRETGNQLRNQDQGNIAQYADRAAEQIERFSGYLREKDVEGLVYEAQDFARRQPLAFLGGAFVLGFVGARFLRSSSPSAGSGSTQGSFEQGRFGSAAYPYGTRPDYPYGRGRYGETVGWGEREPYPARGVPTGPDTGIETPPETADTDEVSWPHNPAGDKDEAA